MKKNLIVIKARTIKIDANFKEAEDHLKKELEKYDVVVTAETMKGCKELSTDLNKMSGDIDKLRKEKLSVMTAPIKDFDAKMKSLAMLCKDGREKLLKQIKVFEDKTRIEIDKKLTELLAELYALNEVKDEYKTATIGDLVILTNITAAGNLSGKAKATVKERVLADLQVQKNVEMRLLRLENSCYKAGLKTPLTEVHVKAFLHTEEQVYAEQLKQLIAVELDRQEKAEELTRKQLIKEAAVVVEEHNAELTEETPVAAKLEPAPSEEDPYVSGHGAGIVKSGMIEKAEDIIEKPTATAGNTFHVIQARFEVSVPSHIPVDRVVAKLQKVMEDAGITTLKEIKVVA